MARLQFTPLAAQDVRDIQAYIAADNPVAARRHALLLKEKCRKLAEMPGLGSVRSELGGLRCFCVGNYLIFYRPANGGIEVIRILHAARDVDALVQESP